MRKLLPYLLILSLILTGCGKNSEISEKPTPPPAPPNNHLRLELNKIIFETSASPKYFNKEMVPAEEGFVVASLFFAFTNHSDKDLDINPEFLEITVADGRKFKASEKTVITGSGAFKNQTLPTGYRGGGLLLFEIPEDQKISRVYYHDDQGNDFTLDLLQKPSKI